MFEMTTQLWGVLLVFVGLCLALTTYLIVREGQSMKKLIKGLALIGPCTGRDLYESGFAKPGTVYTALRIAGERGLVRSRTLPLTDAQLAVRGGIPEREFRLTTKGWSLHQLYQDDE